jgi:adenylylsulfate kinase
VATAHKQAQAQLSKNMQRPKSGNITRYSGGVGRSERVSARGHRGVTLWLTGLSGSGKSTIASEVERRLLERGCAAYVLDGDTVRHGLCRDLGFSPEDRSENNRRIGEVAKLFTDACVLCLCAFISPYRQDRAQLKSGMAPGDFLEIYVRASLETCEARDPKGLYKKARAGQIPDMTGIGAPYEPPEAADLVVDTESAPIDTNVIEVITFLEQNAYIPTA